jgi:hypothetical protein
MKAMASVALVWAALATSNPAAAAEASPAAVLTVTSGPVVVRRGGKTLTVKPPRGLLPGDIVEVGPHAKATLIFPHGPPKEIVATGVKAGFRVEAQAARTQPRRGALARLWRYVLSLVTPRGTRRATPASRGGENCPDGLWPCDSLVRRQCPDFAWQPVRGARYQVVVLDGEGEDVWRSAKLTETRLTYPDDAAELVPGAKYWWEVMAVTEDEVTAAGPYWIELMSPARAEEVDKLLAELAAETKGTPESVQTTARAVALAAEGLKGEALSLLATLSNRTPPTENELKQFQALVAPPRVE